MKLFYGFILVIIIALTSIEKTDNEYDVNNIPLRLLKDAGAVIRLDEVHFEIEDYNSANMRVKYAVTILSKEEQHYGRLELWYDKFREIDDLDGAIYDMHGNKIRELEDSDIKDYSDFENYSLYNDNRVKFIDLYYNQFPYTVEFMYELNFDGYLSFPTWYSRSSLQPVQLTSFEVVTSENYDLRYWCNFDEVKPDIRIEDGEKIYLWKEKNLHKLASDVYGDDIEDVATIVHIAPTDFEIDDYKGNMNSWKSFGSWYYNLSKGRDVLPEMALKEVNETIGSSVDAKEKIEKLYSYLQNKTRYVSVQLGIGSWQPYDAAYVYKNGYGDCKALSNYMVAILKQAGITAYPVLINNGYERMPLITEFPSNQFNHVIVCVPTQEDTTWLECTSHVKPAGSIGWSNENRNALMITPEGGVIVETPVSTSDKNVQIKNLDVKLSFTGGAKVNSRIKWFGNQHDYVIHIAEKSIPKEQEKWIKNLLEVPNIKINSYTFNYDNKKQSEVDLQTVLTLPRYGSVSGSRIFFNPNLIERRTSVPADVAERLSPIRFRYPYLDIDSVIYYFPENYKVEAVPKETNLHSSFGNFLSKTIENKTNTILFIRSLEIKDYLVPAENYSEYQKFFADVVKADKQQVVLVKKK